MRGRRVAYGLEPGLSTVHNNEVAAAAGAAVVDFVVFRREPTADEICALLDAVP